jgi:hypothetical protein
VLFAAVRNTGNLGTRDSSIPWETFSHDDLGTDGPCEWRLSEARDTDFSVIRNLLKIIGSAMKLKFPSSEVKEAFAK